MKRSRQIISLTVMAFLILLPWVTFDAEPDKISEIDNRRLTDTPPLSPHHRHDWVDYIDDRIGFREEAITLRQRLNYSLFNTVTSQSFYVGQNNEFYPETTYPADRTTVASLADHIERMQKYCHDRDVPFLYVIVPEKSEVYSESQAKGYPSGISPSASYMTELLDDKKVNYLDLTPLLIEKMENGERVYNRRFDVYHWNDLGAFYGNSAILDHIHEWFPPVSSDTISDYLVETLDAPYAVNTKFRIDDEYPSFAPKDTVKEPAASMLADARINYQKRTRNVVENDSDGPRLLIFSGSYFDQRQYFLSPHFSHMSTVHNYHNVADLDYYFNIVQPDVVMFTTATYTMNSSFFDESELTARSFNPPLPSVVPEPAGEQDAEIVVSEHGLARICVPQESVDPETQYAWLHIGDTTYDLMRGQWGYNLHDFNGDNDFNDADKERDCFLADIPLTEIHDDESKDFVDMQLYIEDTSGELKGLNIDVLQ